MFLAVISWLPFTLRLIPSYSKWSIRELSYDWTMAPFEGNHNVCSQINFSSLSLTLRTLHYFKDGIVHVKEEECKKFQYSWTLLAI